MMKEKKDIMKEFEAKVTLLKEKYLNDSTSDLYELEENIFSEMQEVQSDLMNSLHQEKTKLASKKKVSELWLSSQI